VYDFTNDVQDAALANIQLHISAYWNKNV